MSIYVVDSGRRVITPLSVDPKIKRVEELESITAIHPLGVQDAGISQPPFDEKTSQYQSTAQHTAGNRRKQPVVATFMSSPLLFLEADWTISTSLAFLEEHDIKHGPVMKDAEIIGLISETQLLKAGLQAGEAANLQDMCEPFMVVEGHSTVAATCLAMLHRRIDAVLIRNSTGQVIGILTTSDILKAISDLELDVWT